MRWLVPFATWIAVLLVVLGMGYIINEHAKTDLDEPAVSEHSHPHEHNDIKAAFLAGFVAVDEKDAVIAEELANLDARIQVMFEVNSAALAKLEASTAELEASVANLVDSMDKHEKQLDAFERWLQDIDSRVGGEKG